MIINSNNIRNLKICHQRYSTDLKLELMVTGEKAGIYGEILQILT
jgi:hypothetical protein